MFPDLLFKLFYDKLEGWTWVELFKAGKRGRYRAQPLSLPEIRQPTASGRRRVPEGAVE